MSLLSASLAAALSCVPHIPSSLSVDSEDLRLKDGICCFLFFFQAEDGIRDIGVTGVQTCALPISEYIGGLINGAGQVNFGIAIPSFDSILIGLNPDSVAPGLTAAAADARPSIAEANITHLAFDLMVGLGSAGVVLMVWYFVVLLGRRRLPQSRWFYRTASLAGIGSYVAIETGWITTEVGRQPWIVYNLMRVDDAVTTAPGSFVWAMLAVLLVVYAVIAIIFVTVLLGLVTRWRHEDERQLVRAPEAGAPYGPRRELAAA